MTAVASGTAVAADRDRRSPHDFHLLWIGETTSALGSSVTSVALPLVALTTLHAGVVAVSLLSAAAWLPWLIIGLPAGAWVDRLRRRPVMIACDVVSLVLFASVAPAAWLGVLTMAQLLTVALLTGVAKVFFSTAYRAYLPVLVGEDELTDANARLQGSESAAQVAGPGVGGILAQALGASAALLADAASFLVSLLCLRRVTTAEPPPRLERRALRTEIGEGVRFVARDRLLRVLLLFGRLANLALTAFGAIEIAFLVRDLGASPGAAGLLLAAGQSGGVLGAVLAPRLARRLGSARAFLLFKLGAPPCGLLMPLVTPGDAGRVVFVGASVGLVACVVAGNVVSAGFVPRYCPRPLLGRVLTTMQFVNFGTIPLGAVLGGVLAAGLGFRPTLWLLMLGWVLSSLILLAAPSLRGRDLPTRPATPAGRGPAAGVS